jgi:hypothetical protein
MEVLDERVMYDVKKICLRRVSVVLHRSSHALNRFRIHRSLEPIEQIECLRVGKRQKLHQNEPGNAFDRIASSLLVRG